MYYKSLLLASSFIALLSACALNNDASIHTSNQTDFQAVEPELSFTQDEYYGVDSQSIIKNSVDRNSAEMISVDMKSVGVINELVSPPMTMQKMPEKKKSNIGLASARSSHVIPAAPRTPMDTSYYYRDDGREKYVQLDQSSIKQVSQAPVSTFSVDVDTGSYSNIRRMLQQGMMPPIDAVRVEEMINYFDYAYTSPESIDEPFSIHTEVAKSPWSSEHVLLKIGLKGYEPPFQDRPSSNLVFLIDVSGSMNSPDKLPLLKKSILLLSKQLDKSDSVAIVVYAGASGIVLEPTQGNQQYKIEQALNQLSAGGSTNGQAGIELAYQLAKKNYNEQGINRVILATDGDFNVGISDVEQLKQLIEEKRKEGISLTTLGFGRGNYNDHLMEQLADVGNGNYAYIDSFSEAKKVLVEQLDATLMTIAKDVKIQIEFNPAVVKQYRLLGYENRALAREDFNNDKVDAGEIGAGHTVTAIYEVVLQTSDYRAVDPLRYQSQEQATKGAQYTSKSMENELAYVKFRYKATNEETSRLLSKAITRPERINEFNLASSAFRFSASVAQFGEVLRNSKYIETDFDSIIANGMQSKGEDPMGYRSEFIQLVRLASGLYKG